MQSLNLVRSSEQLIDRRAASQDCWPLGTLGRWQGAERELPEKIFWPSDEAQIHAVLRAASEQGIPVIPYGAGSGVCGGAAGKQGSWVLDTKGLDKIGQLGQIDADRWMVRVGAGVNGQHLEDWLAARGFTLGHSPSSIGCSSVGGWAAARSAGQFSSKYGVFEDMVAQMRAVSPQRGAFATGEGGDAPEEWLDLLLGSEGTLAVITELTLRISPLPKARWLRGYHMPDISSASEVMRRLMQGELHPAVVRLYDPVDTRIGGKTKPKPAHKDSAPSFFRRWLARVDKLDPIYRRSLALPLALPGLLNSILGQLASGCLLVVGFEGDEAVVDATSRAGHAIATRFGRDLGPEPGERWYASRHNVSYKLMPVFERGGFADTMEIAVRWSDLESAYTAIRGALARHTVVMAHMSHVYPEGACIYFSFAGRGSPEVYKRCWEDALQAALAVGATVTHHHGVGTLKARAASIEVGPAASAWRALKGELDPKKILNPGRLFVEAPYEDPGPIPPPRAEDQLAVAPVSSPFEARREAMWPFERLPGPYRWQRCSWQTPFTALSCEIDGRRALLGRGPRSAAGSDLRRVYAKEGAEVSYALAPPGPRWMGEGRPERPWAAALALLRSDLRPSVLTVVDGALRVGFRGDAAAELGAIAASRVPGGLSEIPFEPAALPSGPLQPCSPDDPGAIAVTPNGVLRRAL